jgi:hypothetical protein
MPRERAPQNAPASKKLSDSPYCSDPNCESCKRLRETHEALKARSRAA